MTKYIHSRDTESRPDLPDEFFDQDSEDMLVLGYAVGLIAKGLMKSWFPDENKQPKDEDLENWRKISISDAEIAIGTLFDLDLLSISDTARLQYQASLQSTPDGYDSELDQ